MSVVIGLLIGVMVLVMVNGYFILKAIKDIDKKLGDRSDLYRIKPMKKEL